MLMPIRLLVCRQTRPSSWRRSSTPSTTSRCRSPTRWPRSTATRSRASTPSLDRAGGGGPRHPEDARLAARAGRTKTAGVTNEVLVGLLAVRPPATPPSTGTGAPPAANASNTHTAPACSRSDWHYWSFAQSRGWRAARAVPDALPGRHVPGQRLFACAASEPPRARRARRAGARRDRVRTAGARTGGRTYRRTRSCRRRSRRW